MAKQTGLLRIEGSMGGADFYKSTDGYLVRRKRRISAKRIKTDPAFKRTRENYSEFGPAAKAAKFLRLAVLPMMRDASDCRVISRITGRMTGVKQLDTTNVRGQRTVANGIGSPIAKNLLKGFNFNIGAEANSLLIKSLKLDVESGRISLRNFRASKSLECPIGATHVRLSAGFAKVDFHTGVGNLEISNSETVAIKTKQRKIELISPKVPEGEGTSIYLFKVVFLQVKKRIEIAVEGNKFNSLEIIEVR